MLRTHKFDVTIVAGFPFTRSEWSSSERSPPAPPAPADAADAVRDAPLYPVLSDATDASDTPDTPDTDAPDTDAPDSHTVETEHATNVQTHDVRTKRSSGQEWDRTPKVSRTIPSWRVTGPLCALPI